MKVLLVACVALLAKCHCKDTSSEEFPDIMDLLPKSVNGSNASRSEDDKNKLLVDLETLDESRLRKNVDTLKKEMQLMDLNSTSTTPKSKARFTPQRRILGYLTDPLVHHIKHYTKTAPVGWFRPRGVHTHMWSVKIADLMIQFIYMARHKLMELDASTIVKPKPENYRQVFLYKHLVRLSDKIWDVHQIIRNQSRLVHAQNLNHMWVFEMLKRAIKLHQKAVKLYVDFTYFWWVFVRTQERFMDRTHVIITRPPSTDFTVRTTASMSAADMTDTDYPTLFHRYLTPDWLLPSWIRGWLG